MPFVFISIKDAKPLGDLLRSDNDMKHKHSNNT